MEEKVIVVFNFRGEKRDIEIPTSITANELVFGLNKGYQLGIDINKPEDCYLRAENPVVLIKGETTLGELGIRNGTTIFYER